MSLRVVFHETALHAANFKARGFITSGPGNQNGPGSSNQNGTDPNRQVMIRFALRVGLAMVIVLFIAPEFRTLVFSSFMVIAALVTGATGAFRQERFNGPTLNHWDEALAFLALANLIGAFADPQTVDSMRS